MTPTNTIREALRRCPVKYGPYTLEPHSAFATGWRWQAEDRRVCTEFDARNAMIAAWVEALVTQYAGMIGADPNTIDGFMVSARQARSNTPYVRTGPTLLHALAATVCEVMPEAVKASA